MHDVPHPARPALYLIGSRSLEHSTTITPVRNVAIDLYRVVAIVFVVLGHWLIAAMTYRDGEFGRQEPLVALPWTQWLRRRLARIIGPTAIYVALVMVVFGVLLGAGFRGPLAVGGWACPRRWRSPRLGAEQIGAR